MKPRVRVYSRENCSWYVYDQKVCRNDIEILAVSWQDLLYCFRVPYVGY